MRNNVVFCANKTVKLNVLHPCVETLKKKLQAFELQHMVQNISLRNSKKRVLIFFEHNLRQDNFLPLKNKLEIRVNGTVKSSPVYNVTNLSQWVLSKNLPLSESKCLIALLLNTLIYAKIHRSSLLLFCVYLALTNIFSTLICFETSITLKLYINEVMSTS